LEVQIIREKENAAFEKERQSNEGLHRLVVKQWLSAADCEAQQDRNRRTRSICANAGTWLLNHPRFREWINRDHCTNPLLWLNGIPGAGMVQVTY
jgi:hypothetical protein